MSTRRVIVLRDDPADPTPAAVRLGPVALNVDALGPPAARALVLDTVEIDKSALAALRRDPSVRSCAEPFLTALAEPVVKEALDAAAAGTGVAWGVQAVGADRSARTGAGVTVAVLDTGIDPAHPVFAGVDLSARDFTGTRADAGDGHGHGTHCAATICGRPVGGLRVGVAPGVARLLVGKVLTDAGTGDTEAMVRGLEWAIGEGAHVVSMSLGFDFPTLFTRLVEAGRPARLAANQALRQYRETLALFDDLVQWAARRGTLVVAAAGNESDRPGGIELDVAPPGAAEGVVSVGAVGQEGAGLAVAPFSNTGPLVVAPGVGIVSAAPGGGYARMSGTSMATPHVAGVAALWAEELLATAGRVAPVTLMNRLVGRASAASLAAGTDPADVGSGLVVAP